jgi:uncharacterized Zn-binding protein involved in type VI secretion
MTTPIHRQGDSRFCGAQTVVQGQGTVYANNRLVSVKGDPNTHTGGNLDASINSAQSSHVYIEGKLAVFQGSTAGRDALGHPGPSTGASSGSPDVIGF